MNYWLTFLLRSCFLILCFTFSARALEPPVAVIIYDEANFGGESLEIRHNTPSFEAMNKRMTSFKITPGYTVRFYSEPNYQGGYYTKTSASSEAANVTVYNNRVQSVEILVDGQADEDKPPVAVTIYDEENYSGKSVEIRYDTPSLGSMNEKMTSFQVAPGYKVRFFAGENYQGGYYTKNSNAREQAHVIDYDNLVRSVKILIDPNDSVDNADTVDGGATYGSGKGSDWSDVAVTIYSQKNYSGEYLEVKENIPNFMDLNIELNSFKVSPGYAVEFYGSDNYRGAPYATETIDSIYDSTPPFKGGLVGSVKIVTTPSPTRPFDINAHPVIATLYDQPNFTGNSLKIRGDVPELRSWGNRIASYKIEPRYKVRFYEDKNFFGTQFYDRSKENSPDSANASFGNRINSIQLVENQLTPVVVTIFKDQSYQGEILEIRRSMPDLGDMNAAISSYIIGCDHNYRVKFYEKPNFEGDNWIFFPCYERSSARGFDDNVRSVEILPPLNEPPTEHIFARLWSHTQHTGTSLGLYHSENGLLPWSFQNRMRSYELLPCYIIEFRSSEMPNSTGTWERHLDSADKRDASSMKTKVRAAFKMGTPSYPGSCIDR